MTSLTKDKFVLTLGNAKVEAVNRKVLPNGQIVDMSSGNLVNEQDIRLGRQLSQVIKVVKTEKSGA